MHPAEKDPYYRFTLKTYGEEGLLEAGWLYNTKANNHFLSFVTPTHKLKKNATNPVVLLTTGAFSPVHQGHLDMMEEAKRFLESKGREVIGGYMSPSHDDYVSVKNFGACAKHHEERITELEAVLETHPWLMVEPWEARYCRGVVNFTEVISHIQTSLSKDGQKAEVVYVFGADNANFAKAFVGKGMSVTVPREGYPTPSWVSKIAPGRTLSAKCPKVYGSSSATRIQEQELLEAIKQVRLNKVTSDQEVRYHFRDMQNSVLEFESTNLVKKKTLQAFIDSFPSIKTIVHNQEEQAKRVEHLREKHQVVSLDSESQGDKNFHITRVFHSSTAQITGAYQSERLGHPSLEEQAQSIKGDCILLDDDISTGQTIKTVSNLLTNANVTGHVSLINDPEMFDVVDLKDFFLGSFKAGLSVQFADGSRGRAMYSLPDVSPTFRAKIPAKQSKEFSYHIWKINFEAFEGTNLMLKDLEPETVSFLLQKGYTLNNLVEKACQDHMDLLE